MERLREDNLVRKTSSMVSFQIFIVVIITVLLPFHIESRNIQLRQIDESQFPLEGETRPADSGSFERDDRPFLPFSDPRDVVRRTQPLDITNIGQEPWVDVEPIDEVVEVEDEVMVAPYDQVEPANDQPVEYVQYDVYDDVPSQLQSQSLSYRAKNIPETKVKEIGERQTFIETKILEACCCYIGSNETEKKDIRENPRDIVLEEGVMMGVIINTPFCFIPRPVDITCNFRVSTKNNHGMTHHLKSEPDDASKGTVSCGLEMVHYNSNGVGVKKSTICQSQTVSLEPGASEGGIGYQIEVEKGKAFNFDASFTLLGKVGPTQGRSASASQETSRPSCTIKALPGQTKKCGKTDYCIPMAAECNGYNDCPAPKGQTSGNANQPTADEEEKESCPEQTERIGKKSEERKKEEERMKRIKELLKGIALKPGGGGKNSRNLKHAKEEEEWRRLQSSIVELADTMEDLSGLDSNFFSLLAGTIGLILLFFAVCLQFVFRAMAVIDNLIIALTNVGNWLSMAKSGVMRIPCVKTCFNKVAGRSRGGENSNETSGSNGRRGGSRSSPGGEIENNEQSPSPPAEEETS